ncbi:phage minor head protein [Pseudovibrio exalbescens]|uniref:phage minor head protein n=1 Tax=Pseudovibrio exalbescens TaxID=197461 RepID=UPI000C9D0BD8|nr:phage minor head protein [Pseudovibrio exalbescens]
MARNQDPFSRYEEEYIRRLERVFGDAVQNIKDRVTLKALIRALRAGDVETALRVLDITEDDFQELDITLEELYRKAGEAFGEDVPPIRDPLTGAVIQFSFTARNPRAERWLLEQSSKLVREVTESVKETARQELQAGLAQGKNPRATALELVGRLDRAKGKREGGSIGLTSTQAQHVANLKAQLASGDPAKMKQALDRKLIDKRYTRTIQKAIREGKPVPADKLQRIVDLYKGRYIKYRGEVIARTETLRALGASQREAWQQSIDKGHAAEQDIRRYWVTAGDERVRGSHRVIPKMNKGGVGWNEPFKTPTGDSLNAPHDHDVMCRCRTRIKVDYIAAGLRRREERLGRG